jgi:hypothetical protein
MLRLYRLVGVCIAAAMFMAPVRADAPPTHATSNDAADEAATETNAPADLPAAPQATADDDGVLTLPNGDETTARFGTFDYTGIARFVWKDGHSYSGDFVDGRPQGHGIEQLPDGSTYDGGWVDGRHDGNGSMTLPDGSRYDGAFTAGARNGQGLFQSSSGRYQGEWVDDMPQGAGRFDYIDGASYDGNWMVGRRNGFGVYRRPDGSSYEGDWENDMPDGYGQLVEPDGYTYDGSWMHGQRSGYGAMKIGDLFGYEGTWRANERQGYGREVRPDGGEYVGDWVADQRQGHGVLRTPSGARHDGLWASNTPKGDGTRTSAEGIRIVGTWDGDFVSSGTITLHSGLEYRGALYEPTSKSVDPSFLAWLERSADEGDVDAALLLGQAYHYFVQPSPDRAKAIAWYGRAADGGVAEAQYQLAELLLEDSTSTPRALELLRLAAAQGHASANTRLGVFFQLGTHVRKNHAQAQHYYEVATVQGDLTARNNLAWLLATSPSSDLRNGRRAVTLVQPLAVLYDSWGYLDTLAAAQAEAGNFDAASRTERKAVDLAQAQVNPTTLRELEQRLTLFQRDEPYREP